jgi:hypothetical protein
LPPSTWIASVALATAASEAKVLAIDASLSEGFPAAAAAADFHTSPRAASTRIAMSASSSWIA